MVDNEGFDPSTSRMLSVRSTNWASRPVAEFIRFRWWRHCENTVIYTLDTHTHKYARNDAPTDYWRTPLVSCPMYDVRYWTCSGLWTVQYSTLCITSTCGRRRGYGQTNPPLLFTSTSHQRPIIIYFVDYIIVK